MALPTIVPTGFAGDYTDFFKTKADRGGDVRRSQGSVSVPSAPVGYLLCYGQTVSRTTYADLFTAIGTTWGAGDGTTTFGIPDLRGRLRAGKDDMGGTAANRLTTAGGGVDGITLGAVGGAQSHTLTIAQLPTFTPTASATSGGDHSHLMFAAAGTQASISSTNSPVVMGNVGNTFDYTIQSKTGLSTPTLGLTGSSPIGAISVTINPIGSGNAHPIVQPTAIMNAIIKT